MSLPALSWSLVGPLRLNLSGSPVGPGVSQPKAHMLYTLSQLVASSTYWQATQDVTGSQLQALVLQPRMGPLTGSLRVIFTAAVTGSAGGSASATVMQDRQAGTADTNPANDDLLIGFSPDVSPNSTYTTGSFNSDFPWGSTVRWSKYWTASTNATVTTLDQMYLIESQESVCVGVRGYRGNTGHHLCGAGALVTSYDSGSGEQVDSGSLQGRVYGMFTSLDVNAGSFLASLNQGPFGHISSADSTHFGVFIVSGGVPNGPHGSGGANSSNFELMTRLTLFNVGASGDSGNRGQTTTTAESLVGMLIAVQSFASPFRLAGFLRQVHAVQDMVGPMVLCTGSNVPVAVAWSYDNQATSDTIVFSNSP